MLNPQAVDCRNCFHDNESHDPLIGCLMCACNVRYPAAPKHYPTLRTMTPEASRMVRDVMRQVPAKGRHHRPRGYTLRAFLASRQGLVLACLLVAASFLMALLALLIRGW